MTEQTTIGVRRSVTVKAPPERAFEVFTAGFSTWWPLASHHIGEKDAVEAVIEPRSGGRWFERAADGTECDWGYVTEFEPPSRVLLAWHLDPEWGFDPDPAHATEVEVTFTPTSDGTLVELEHRGFEKHGLPGAKMRELVNQPGGWGDLMEMFAKEVDAVG
jgi:uncharacterized protein YndB with AHSA1/START domain